MEDDFIACPNTIRALHYMIAKAHTVDPTWITIKLSYGMNGFILKNNEDLQVFSKYLVAGQRRYQTLHNSPFGCVSCFTNDIHSAVNLLIFMLCVLLLFCFVVIVSICVLPVQSSS